MQKNGSIFDQGSLPHQHLLKEIQALFNRQKNQNFIEVFLNVFNETEQQVVIGLPVEISSLNVRTPQGDLFDTRSFRGSALSHSMAMHLNERYGIFSFLIALFRAVNDPLAREIVRSLSKGVVEVCSMHTQYHHRLGLIDANVSRDHLPKVDEFFAKTFEKSRILRNMRLSSRKELIRLSRRLKAVPDHAIPDDADLAELLPVICTHAGLPLDEAFAAWPHLNDLVLQRRQMQGFFVALQLYFTSIGRRKKFYRAIEAAVGLPRG